MIQVVLPALDRAPIIEWQSSFELEGRMGMGIATTRVEGIVKRPLSGEEIQRRQREAEPDTQRVATTNGGIADPPRTPQEEPQEVFKAGLYPYD